MDEYANDMDILLRRWGRWMRAGTSGISAIGHSGRTTDFEFRDVVAEMLDQLIAKLPKRQRNAVMDIWWREKSETQSASERRISRGRFKSLMSNAIGWLCARLAARIDAAPTVDNVDRWERRQYD